MTQEERSAIRASMTEEQKACVERLYREKMLKLFALEDEEYEKIEEKWKAEGRLRRGLDAMSGEPEYLKHNEKFKSMFNALPGECICEVLGIQGEDGKTRTEIKSFSDLIERNQHGFLELPEELKK